MIAKVQTISPTGKDPWNSPNGILYSFNITLSDGCQGEVNSKNIDGPPYKVGDEVEYEVTRDDPTYGKKLKVKKADSGFNKQSKGSSSYDPLPGFCANNIAFCITEVRSDNGHEDFTMEQLVTKMVNLHKMHDQLTKLVRERINN